MVIAARLVVAVALVGLFYAPAMADVVPTRYADASPAKEQVQARLTELGLQADASRERLARLTPDEAAFFAAQPERVQVVGQEMWAGQANNLWWEWLFGIGALVGAGFIVYNFGVAND